MLGNRGRDTSPELAVRRILHRAGLRYRVNIQPDPSVRRKADIVFTRRKVAVFIDGCYWHGCQEHFKMPKTNLQYWTKKIEGNRSRDADTDRRLGNAGWSVLRYWEHEAAMDVAQSVLQHVRERDETPASKEPSRVASNKRSAKY